MTIRQISRLIIGIPILTLAVVLLFSGPAASAGRDRAAPTAPANLVVTAVSDTTVSLSWQGSTDNSGKFSYKVRINNLNNSYNTLATVSQTQTTYTAKYLASNSPYAFSVYAIDDSGNRSADSNSASASTLADTTPPGGLVLQSATPVAPSQVQLVWTKATDTGASYCCSYTVNVNGAPLTGHVNWVISSVPNTLSVIVRHLQPGSTNAFSVSATDSTGANTATSNIINATTPPSSDVLPPTVPTNLHLVRDDSCGEVWLGWTESSDNGGDSQDKIEYEIYVNGVISPLPVGAGIDVDFVYANNHGDNIFTVKAVDKSGNTSSASAPLKLFLWPC